MDITLWFRASEVWRKKVVILWFAIILKESSVNFTNCKVAVTRIADMYRIVDTESSKRWTTPNIPVTTFLLKNWSLLFPFLETSTQNHIVPSLKKKKIQKIHYYIQQYNDTPQASVSLSLCAKRISSARLESWLIIKHVCVCMYVYVCSARDALARSHPKRCSGSRFDLYFRPRLLACLLISLLCKYKWAKLSGGYVYILSADMPVYTYIYIRGPDINSEKSSSAHLPEKEDRVDSWKKNRGVSTWPLSITRVDILRWLIRVEVEGAVEKKRLKGGVDTWF